MKRLLLAISLFLLVGCEDSGNNDGRSEGVDAGFDAGYRLTCGISWSAGNRFVVDNEFAHKFLVGARACAREHPERARQVLGLAGEKMLVSAKETDGRTEPEPEMTEAPMRREAVVAAPRRTEVKQASAKAAKKPVQARASDKVAAPVRSKAPAKAKAYAPAKASPKRQTPPKVTAPARATVTAEAPAAAKAPVQEKAPAKAKASVQVATGSSKGGNSPSPKTANTSPSVPVKSWRQVPRKKPSSSYERFMGR